MRGASTLLLSVEFCFSTNEGPFHFCEQSWNAPRKQKFIFQLELKRAKKKKKHKLAECNAGLEDSDSDEE